MEITRRNAILKNSIWLLNSGSEVYICDTFLEQKRIGYITTEEFDFIEKFFGKPCDVPPNLRGLHWVGTEFHFWERNQIEPRIKYLEYLIEQL